MPPVLKSRYGQAAILVGAVFSIGRALWGWGFITAAFGLIVYLLMAIGIRLDDLVQDIRALREARKNEVDGHARLMDLLAALDATLDRIDRHLSPAAPPRASDTPAALEVASRD